MDMRTALAATDIILDEYDLRGAGELRGRANTESSLLAVRAVGLYGSVVCMRMPVHDDTGLVDVTRAMAAALSAFDPARELERRWSDDFGARNGLDRDRFAALLAADYRHFHARARALDPAYVGMMLRAVRNRERWDEDAPADTLFMSSLGPGSPAWSQSPMGSVIRFGGCGIFHP